MPLFYPKFAFVDPDPYSEYGSGSRKLLSTDLIQIRIHNTDTSSVADPYHFDTDLDPGCEKIRYGSRSGVNFDTDPDPGKNDTDPDPAKKD